MQLTSCHTCTTCTLLCCEELSTHLTITILTASPRQKNSPVLITASLPRTFQYFVDGIDHGHIFIFLWCGSIFIFVQSQLWLSSQLTIIINNRLMMITHKLMIVEKSRTISNLPIRLLVTHLSRIIFCVCVAGAGRKMAKKCGFFFGAPHTWKFSLIFY